MVVTRNYIFSDSDIWSFLPKVYIGQFYPQNNTNSVYTSSLIQQLDIKHRLTKSFLIMSFYVFLPSQGGEILGYIIFFKLNNELFSKNQMT